MGYKTEQKEADLKFRSKFLGSSCCRQYYFVVYDN